MAVRFVLDETPINEWDELSPKEIIKKRIPIRNQIKELQNRMKLSYEKLAYRSRGLHLPGRKMHSKGMVMIRKPNHHSKPKSKYVQEHRLVMEEYLDRPLEPMEVVHHINRNRADNRIKNLKLFKNESEHRRWHWFEKKNSPQPEGRMS